MHDLHDLYHYYGMCNLYNLHNYHVICTGTNAGVEFSMYSTPLLGSTVLEHLSFVTGLIESVTPIQVNGLRLVQDSVNSGAGLTIDADKVITEVNAYSAIAPEILGIDATDQSYFKIISNNTGLPMTIRQESLTVGAGNRLFLPDSKDMVIPAGGSATFYRRTTTGWATVFGIVPAITDASLDVKGAYGQFTAARDGRVGVTLYSFPPYRPRNTVLFTSDSYGNLYSAGSGANGDLGDGTIVNKSSPVLVLGGYRFAHFDHTIAVSLDDKLYSWGLNTSGQVGDGTVISKSSPVLLSLSNVSAVFAGRSDTAVRFALTSNGYLYGWGLQATGQLGVGDVIPRSVPTAVVGARRFSYFQYSPWIARAAGIERDTALAYMWGNNALGALGTGDVINRSSPTAVVGGLKYRKVLPGFSATVGITTDNKLYVWGDNAKGLLANGTLLPTYASTPTLVVSAFEFNDVFICKTSSPSGADAIFATTKDGTAYTWGDNRDGILGVGDILARSTPTAVLGGIKFDSIFGSGETVYGISKDQKLYAWGSSIQGSVSASSPTLVSGTLKVVSALGFENGVEVVSTTGVFYIGAGNALAGVNDLVAHSTATPVLLGPSPWQANSPIEYQEFNVTEGLIYTIQLGQGDCFWNTVKIGKRFSRAVIDYVD